MYKKEFDKLLLSKVPNITLIYGDNSFWFDYYRDFFINMLNAKESFLEHLYEDYNIHSAKAYLAQASLFGDVNLYILRTAKKISKNELEELIKISNKNMNNYFLYIYEGNSSDAKSLQNIFSQKNNAIWVRFFEPNFKESLEFAKVRTKELNLDISHYTLSYLVELLNFNMALINNELKKLSILKEEITINIIDDLIYSAAPLKIEKMIVDLFKKKDIKKTLNKLIELGEDEITILRTFQRFLNQIFLFIAHIKLYGNANSKEILGYKLPKNIEEERASIAINLNSSKLLRIYEELLDIEIKMKKSNFNKESLLYGGLLKIREIL